MIKYLYSRPNCWKNFLSIRVGDTWNNLLEDVVNCPSLEIFKKNSPDFLMDKCYELWFLSVHIRPWLVILFVSTYL